MVFNRIYMLGAKSCGLTLACLLLTCLGASAQTLTNGLVGYWPMDNTQLTELTDHTSVSNHGAFVDGSPTWVSGKFGNALEVYETTLDEASIPHHASYNANNTYSISFWFYPISTYRLHNQFSKGAGKVALGHSAAYPDMQMEQFGSPWTATATGAARSPSAWHHFVIMYDPTGGDYAKQVYVDGALVLTNATTGVGSDSALNTDPIGFSSSGSHCSARYDDVAIWDRVLTVDEITNLYNSGTGNIVADLNPLPTAPTNIVTTASDELAILSWATNIVDPDTYVYDVYRDTSSGGPYTRVASNLTETSCVDTNLVNGTPYYYVIRTVDLRGSESTNSVEVTVTPAADSTPPAVPSGLSAEGGYTRVYLSWSANSEDDFAGYNIYGSLSAGGPFTLQQALITTVSWTQDGLTNDVIYHYRITSEDYAGNESSPTAAVSAEPAAFQDTNLGLVGYWPLDETSGTNLIDESLNGNDGVFVSGTPYWTTGKLGNALALDNENDTVSELALIPHHNDYIVNDTFSISFWHKPISGYRNGGQFRKGSGVLGMGHLNSDAHWAYFGSAPWASTDLGYDLYDGVWHLVAIVYDPSVTYGKLVYVDGAIVASNTAVAGPLDSVLNTDPVEFLAATGRPCTNRFDDVAIWDVALTVDQVESLWNEGDGRTAYTPPNAGTLFIFQ